MLAVLPLVITAGCRSTHTQGPLDPALAAFAPADSLLLAGFHVQELMASPVYRKLAAQKGFPRFTGLAGQTGFDPERDVKELTAAYNGQDTVLIARGTFQVRIPESAPKTEYKGYTLYGNAESAFVLVDGRTALAGTPPGVRAAIDRSRQGGGGPDLLRYAQALPAASQIWAVGDNRLAAKVPQTGNLANLRNFFDPLEYFSLVAEVGESLHATLTGNFRTEADAQNLTVAAKGILGLGRLSIPENQSDLARLYDAVSVEQRQRSIKVEASVPADLVDKALALLGGR